jgi:Cu/Ag efflux protein CusF
MKRTTIALALAIGGLVGTTPRIGAAQDQNKQTQQITRQSESHVTATVAAIDKQKREVTLKDNAGDTVVVTVPEEVGSIDKLKVGQPVDVTYYESVAISLDKSNATKPKMEVSQATTGTPGQGGATGRQMDATVKIKKVDAAKNKVTFEGPDGKSHTVTIDDPELQQKLPQLKKGDMIRIVYTEAVAASITPSSKK